MLDNKLFRFMTNKEEIKKYLSALFPRDETDEHIIEEFEGQLCVNGYCYLPIKIAFQIDRSSPIIIVDEESEVLGEVYFFDQSNYCDVNSLNEIAYTTFLLECKTEVIHESQYKFIYDYIVIKKNKLLLYLNDYKSKTPIWGGFFHVDDLPNNSFNLKRIERQITAIKDIEINKPYYLELLEQIILETNPFNRFLKRYHLLEMQFDMHTAHQIERLVNQGGKEKEISEILRDYVRDDIERLKSLFKSKIDRTKLEPYLTNILSHSATAKQIFYYKEKESNPLRSELKFDKLMEKPKINQVNFDMIFGSGWYENKIHSVIAYWIYRVRSSIAHNKLGEYVLTKDDEAFIVDFAEPLLGEVIKHCYKSK